MDQGFYKAEGLDASFITLPGRALVTAGLTGSIDFIPIPSGGSQAALSGAEIRYVVGQSLKSQWLIVARPNINKPEDLRGKTLGYGRAGSADYDEGAAVMSRAFKMELGRDYKVISFQGEGERVAAMINGDVDAALITVPHAPRAIEAGMKILVRVGDHIQRAGGSFWTRKAYVDEHPETVKKFIRAIARGVMFYRDNKAGSMASLKEHLGVANDKDAGIVWEETHNTMGAELPAEQFREIFESRRDRHDRRQAMGAGQAVARSGAVPGALAARPDAEADELRADQARRSDADRVGLPRSIRQHRRSLGRTTP